ncbi:MAG: hypothetical protein LBI81_00630 [Puniceicoccales bacterium]|jgi:hypothetical protein|nr:hypothetical protein [Puniceicoccales bacterium]
MESEIKSSPLRRNRAFTLLEIILSLLVIVTVVFFGKKFLDISAENVRSLEESKIVDGELNLLLTRIREDLESAVLLEKNQPIFEICEKGDGKSLDMFFFTTNDEKHVTVGVRYDISELEFGHVEVQRTVLSDSATLLLQNALSSGSSFSQFFENMDPSHRQVYKFNVRLSSFKIRAAVENSDGRVIFIHPNEKMAYFSGKLVCENVDRKSIIPGNLLFFDITVRALLKNDIAKFNSLKASKPADAKEFLSMQSRKSFGRIKFNAMSF